MLDPGSLTRKLIALSRGHFRVRVARQHWDQASADEALLLGIPLKQKVLVREVALIGYDQVWVTARSLIPVSTLHGKERQLRALGERPLGAYLFSSRAMRRGPMQILAHPNGRSLPLAPSNFSPAWGRRSVFYLNNKPLLVSEFFSPCLVSSDLPGQAAGA